jgi:hypothetical protein
MKLSHVLIFAVSIEKERAFSRLQTAPTYTPNMETLRACDIINPVSHSFWCLMQNTIQIGSYF